MGRHEFWAVPHSLIELVLFDQHAIERTEIGDGANDGLGFSGTMPEIDEGTEEGIDDGDYCRRRGQSRGHFRRKEYGQP